MRQIMKSVFSGQNSAEPIVVDPSFFAGKITRRNALRAAAALVFQAGHKAKVGYLNRPEDKTVQISFTDGVALTDFVQMDDDCIIGLFRSRQTAPFSKVGRFDLRSQTLSPGALDETTDFALASPDGKLILCHEKSEQKWLWRVRTGRTVGPFDRPADEITCTWAKVPVAWMPDSNGWVYYALASSKLMCYHLKPSLPDSTYVLPGHVAGLRLIGCLENNRILLVEEVPTPGQLTSSFKTHTFDTVSGKLSSGTERFRSPVAQTSSLLSVKYSTASQRLLWYLIDTRQTAEKGPLSVYATFWITRPDCTHPHQAYEFELPEVSPAIGLLQAAELPVFANQLPSLSSWSADGRHIVISIHETVMVEDVTRCL